MSHNWIRSITESGIKSGITRSRKRAAPNGTTLCYYRIRFANYDR